MTSPPIDEENLLNPTESSSSTQLDPIQKLLADMPGIQMLIRREVNSTISNTISVHPEDDAFAADRDMSAQKFPRDLSAQTSHRDMSAHNSTKGHECPNNNERDMSALPARDGISLDPAEDSSASRPSSLDVSAINPDSTLENLLNPGPVQTAPEENFLSELQAEMALDQVSGTPIDADLAKIIQDYYLKKSCDNAAISTIIKANPIPENLGVLKPPKMNPELTNNKRFVDNENFVLSNENTLYSSSNIISRTLSILAKIANSAFQATKPNAEPADDRATVRDALSAITLIGSLAADSAQRRRNNVRKLCSDDFKSLCGPPPGSADSKKKPANKGTEYLLGDNIKEASKEAKRGVDICRQSTSSATYTRPAQHNSQDNQRDFRRGNQSTSRYRQQQRPRPYYQPNQQSQANNNNRQNQRQPDRRQNSTYQPQKSSNYRGNNYNPNYRR